ncbi:unnamed protein product [Zymoseptoria tritici ST99CH_3D7]|uniref:Homologous-pairing protein 2 winged helix domain-containing protein n=1 Tax=Zymoseptoria tritici (strain ST99CH_3D7) TaxID=1276538 RepID=A0A1X7S6J3_ZYMT9|nr:unnamed protein product [Zymoseptoria tritici ST99CH_3D7]
MAPTKEKGEAKEPKLTPEQSAAAILTYLRKENRPYSATDISSNLHNRVTKTAAQKLLKDMHERKEIEGRASGKQIVYHVIQDEVPDDFLEKLAEMDREITRLREETVALKAEEKELKSSLRGDAARIPMPELKASVEALQAQKDEVEARLVKLRSGSLKPVSAEEREKIDVMYRKVGKVAKNRAKIRLELWAEVKGIVEKEKWEDLKETLGLEF